MTAPINIWHINAGGYKGTFDITSIEGARLTGVINIDPGFTDKLDGIWNEATHIRKLSSIASQFEEETLTFRRTLAIYF